MAKQPKRQVGIRISTEPEITSKRKSTELPFHILFISDLAPQQASPSSRSDSSHVISVDKNSFSQVMQHLAPRLVLEVPNRIGDGPSFIELELSFPELKAFRPEGIVAQIPSLARLLQVRKLVDDVRSGSLPPTQFQERAIAAGIDRDLAERFQQMLVQAPTPTPSRIPAAPAMSREPSPQAPTQKGKLGSLLDMVDMGTEETQGPPLKSDPMAALLQAITAGETAGPSGAPQPGVEKSAAEMMIGELESILGDQINAILHHPEYQRLEAAWRGLKFLVDRIDFRKNIRLSVLPARKADLSDALHQQIVEPTLRGRVNEILGAPVSVAVADVSFEHTNDEVDRLEPLLEKLASIQLPLVAGVGPAFFGRQSPSEFAELPPLWQHFQSPQYIRWNSLRDQATSNYLLIALPQFLLRFSYGPENPVKEFRFVESADGMGAVDPGSKHKRHLWGSGALGVAAALVGSFAETGWPTHISGIHAGGRIVDLPVWDYPFGGARARVPLEAVIPEGRLVELSESGFAVLGCRLNEDAAYVAFAPMVHRPEKFEDAGSNDEARLHSTLACQLMAARLAHHISLFSREMAPGLSPKKLQTELKDYVQALLESGGRLRVPKAVSVKVSESSEAPDRCSATMRVCTPEEILGRETVLTMTFDLPLA